MNSDRRPTKLNLREQREELPAMTIQENIFYYKPCIRETPKVSLAQRQVWENEGMNININTGKTSEQQN